MRERLGSCAAIARLVYDLLRPTAEGSIKAFGAAICQADQTGMEFFTDEKVLYLA